MSTTDAATTPAAEQARYGGFWVRLGAHLVDYFIISFISVAAVTGVALVVTGKFTVYGEISLVTMVVAMFYHASFVASESMATPGKRLFGLYVTDDQGRRLDIGHALGRHVAAALSWITLGIGFLMIAYSDRKQALHDHKAGTLVRRKPGASTGGMIVVFVIVFVLVFGGGVMYAVGVPVMMEYAAKQQMEDLHQRMSANKVPIQEYAKKNREWPTTWAQVESAGGKNPMDGLDDVGKAFIKSVSMEPDASMVAEIEIEGRKGKLRMGPQRAGNRLGWTCNASPEIVRFMPENCGAMQ
jgi:uncharacterized RDD family membrane protein YckC